MFHRPTTTPIFWDLHNYPYDLSPQEVFMKLINRHHKINTTTMTNEPRHNKENESSSCPFYPCTVSYCFQVRPFLSSYGIGV